MILRRFIKSWKGIAILLLTLFSVFCVSLVYTGMQTQWITVQENEKLKSYVSEIETWKTCMENTNLYTIEGEKYTKLSEIQECGKHQ